jgi:hypothetical protein
VVAIIESWKLRVQKEELLGCAKVPSQCLPERAEENHEIPGNSRTFLLNTRLHSDSFIISCQEF